MPTWPALILWFACLAAVWDLSWRTIPRWLTVTAGTLGLGHALLTGVGRSSLLATVLGLALGALLWQLDAVGGGDAKWLAAAGALLGLRVWCLSVILALLVAAAVALVQLARRRRLGLLGERLASLVRGWRIYGLHPNPECRLDTADAVAAPFGPALAIGIICALLLV
ncbi:MAG: prepilin peptidase [Terriglobales bacterium]